MKVQKLNHQLSHILIIVIVHVDHLSSNSDLFQEAMNEHRYIIDLIINGETRSLSI